jgi:hypothetical protein
MSLLFRRFINRARAVVKLLEDKMPRDLARIVGGYMSPEPEAEFGVKLGEKLADITEPRTRAWVCPVLDQSGSRFYMACDADLWPIGWRRWDCSTRDWAPPEPQAGYLLLTNADKRFRAEWLRVAAALRATVGDVPFVQPGWSEGFESPRLQLRMTTREFKAGRYRLIFEVRTMVVRIPWVDQWDRTQHRTSNCHLWFIDGVRLGPAKHVRELPEPSVDRWGVDSDIATEEIVKPSERPPRVKRKID